MPYDDVSLVFLYMCIFSGDLLTPFNAAEAPVAMGMLYAKVLCAARIWPCLLFLFLYLLLLPFFLLRWCSTYSRGPYWSTWRLPFFP